MHEHHHHAAADHGHHDHARDAKPAALAKALALTGTFLIVELIGGILTGSLALLSDAAHMFTDTAALAIALAATHVARRPADAQRTFGYQRFEILAASLNAILLFLVALYILYEGYRRFIEPPEVRSLGMLAIALLGLVVNLVAMRVLTAGADSDVNLRGAYLEVWSDMLGSLGVVAGAVILWLTGWTWVDTAVAVAIGLWVLPRAWSLLSETTNVLLEGVPKELDLAEIEAVMRACAGVVDVHDLHVWALSSNQPSLSAHLLLAAASDADAVRKDCVQLLARRFHIEHVTLQTERVDCRSEGGGGLVHA